MQQPGELDLVMYQGATFEYTLTWLVSGSPVDLGGYQARMQVRQNYTSPTAVLSIETGEGITLGGAAGTIDLFVNAEVTDSIAAQRWVYDLELESSGGRVTRLVQGALAVIPQVTR